MFSLRRSISSSSSFSSSFSLFFRKSFVNNYLFTCSSFYIPFFNSIYYNNYSSFNIYFETPALKQFKEKCKSEKSLKLLSIPVLNNTNNIPLINIKQEYNYITMIKQAIRLEYPDIAYELFHQYWNFKCPINSRILDLLFTIHSNLLNSELLLQDIDMISSYFQYFTDNTFTLLIQALSDCNEFKKAKELFLWLENEGIKPLVHTYNALLSSADSYKVTDIINKMKEENIDLNLRSFYILTKIYAREDKILLLEGLLDKFDEYKIIPTSDYLSYFIEKISHIDGYTNTNLGDIMWNIVDKYDLAIEHDFYTELSFYYSIIHSPEKGYEFIKECEEELGIVNDQLNINVFLGYINISDYKGACNFLKTIENNIHDELVTDCYSQLLLLTTKQNCLYACDIIAYMQENSIVIDNIIFNGLVYELVQHKQITSFKLIEEIWKKGFQYNAEYSEETMNLLVSKAKELQEYDTVKIFILHMYNSGMTITQDILDAYHSKTSELFDSIDIPSFKNMTPPEY